MTTQNLSDTKRALLEKWMKGQLTNDAATIPQRPDGSSVPLSFPQQRQLFLELLDPGTAVNNLHYFLEIKGVFDIKVVEQSANQILERHEVLRTGFCFGQGMPIPEKDNDARLSIQVVRLKKSDESEQAAEARQLAETEVLQPFDLSKAPLIRLKYYEAGTDTSYLLIVIHHSIADGWSLGVFLKELMEFYQQITMSKPASLPQLQIQYPDFAYWQNNQWEGDTLRPSLEYWKKQLAGELPVLALPTDKPRGSRQTYVTGTHYFVLSETLTDALEKISKQEDATLFMTLLSAFYMVLNRYSGQQEILVGTPTANRNLPELEPLIGVFINTLVLRVNLEGEPNFRELLRRVREVSLEAFAHKDLPFEKVVEELKPRRDLSRPPLFQVVFNLQNSPMPGLNIPGVEIRPLELDSGASQFDLTLMISRAGGQCRATVEYNRDLFSQRTISGMFQSFQMMLEDAIARPDCPVSRLQLVTREALHPLVYEFNQTHLDFPRSACMHQLFEMQVLKTPDSVAVIFGETQITYSELNQQANLLAIRLRAMGVGPEIRVGIFMEKTSALIIGLLGVLKAGGTYVPIHPSFPAERVQFLLEDAEVRVLLTNVDTGLPGELKNVEVIYLTGEKQSPENTVSNPETHVKPENLAYIMYTSGSTGQPKGVMVQHSSLVNFLWSMRTLPGMQKEDVLLTVTSISFDIAALEIFLPLITGATLVIPGKEISTNPFLLAQAIKNHRVTVMQATPATWQLLVNSGWAGEPGLKALCGGEALNRNLADKLLNRVGMLWNMYGPTETTIWSSVARVQKGDDPITIGRPIGNTQLYILDHHLQPVPVGIIGELHIAGEGLSRGYLNREQLTHEKFIRDCFSVTPGARMFKTGDYARFLPNGSIEVLGRMDEQVKINGYRIEPGEIVSVLLQHPSIREAMVIARSESSGEKRLVAYFAARGGQIPDAAGLQEFVRKKLPVYMIPVVFIPLDHLPLSANGKIDRKALPLPEDIRSIPGFEAPGNEIERMLAGIWQDVLELEQVGIHDNFFDLGGASIQSLQVVAHANMAGFGLSAENIFEFQTIAELASHIQLKKKDQLHPAG